MQIQIAFIGIALSTIFDINNAFHLNLHALEWLNASNYCQSFCNSNLASIHSRDAHLKTLDLIDHNPYIYTRVWLGLNDIKTSDTWEWSDGSDFNFGNIKNRRTGLIRQGNYPWRGDEPDYNNNDQGLALEVGSQFAASNTRKWIDRNIAANYHFFCNDCSGKIQKYAVLNEFVNQTDAQKLCEDTFGTSLASIHNYDDTTEAINACKQITGSNGCWIGLNDIKARRNYEWTDGTEWDYGTEFFKYPWYKSEPGATINQHCIFMDPSNGNDPGEYLWDDYWCYKQYPRALCNAPSEICNSNEWTIITGDSNKWTWNKKPCHIVKTMEPESMAILSNKQYLNTNGVLKIDMMYSILYTPKTNGNAGIVLYIDEYRNRAKCNNYYYIGINAEQILFFGMYIKNIFTIITSKNVSEFNLGTQYLLSIELTQGTEWNILLNKQPMIAISHDELTNANNLLSGYIGIRNMDVEMYIKYLYISGNIQYEDNNIWNNQCANLPTFAPTDITLNPSISPTKYPTKSPTVNPTKFPTIHPTVNPTVNPSNPSIPPTLFTSQPSNNPSISPTKYPTESPSHNPSVFPSRNPTKYPTIPPTDIPTKLPTNYPSLNPTQNPSKKPTNYPSNNPSTKPTQTPTNYPTYGPTVSPSKNPTELPTKYPTKYPTTGNPTTQPSKTPTNYPTVFPSQNPSKFPTENPIPVPSRTPTDVSTPPSENPTKSPTKSPIKAPTKFPTKSPTTPPPTTSPAKSPTQLPTQTPTKSPNIRPTFLIEREFPIIQEEEKKLEGDSKIVTASVTVSALVALGICVVIVYCAVKPRLQKRKKRQTMDTLPDVELHDE